MAEAPAVNLLSNGHYRLAITAAGGGYSACGARAVTRWQPDPTCDRDGFFIYLRDLESRQLWSHAWQPTQVQPDFYEVRFDPGQTEFLRRDDQLEARLTICVAPASNVEIRRCRLRNLSSRPRRIELTSYLEPVLQSQASDAAHPAFSKLFLQTSVDRQRHVLWTERRTRSPDDRPYFAAHFLAGNRWLQAERGSYETDRAQFLGRGRSCYRPKACRNDGALTETVGSVLDPIASWRITPTLNPHDELEITFALAVGESRAEVGDLVRQFTDQDVVHSTLRRAAELGSAELSRWNLSLDDYLALCKVSGQLLFDRGTTPQLDARVFPSVDGRRGPQPTDARSVLCHVTTPQDLQIAHNVICCLPVWRHFNIPCKLTIAAADRWRPDVLQQIDALNRRDLGADHVSDIDVVLLEDLTSEEWSLLQTRAHVRLSKSSPPTDRGWQTHLSPIDTDGPPPSEDNPHAHTIAAPTESAPAEVPQPLLFDNGYGGFAPDGREYVIRLRPDDSGEYKLPPLPWSNVISNEQAGFVVTETGAGCTWFGNSREFRLTPWYNDPVSDPHGEALYLHDDAGHFWSPLPGPVRGGGRYEVRHGLGYTRFRHTTAGIDHEVWQFVPRHDPVKITILRLTNCTAQDRELTLSSYHQWVLGTSPADTRLFVETFFDRPRSAVLAQNPASRDFSQSVAFAALAGGFQPDSLQATGDRCAFLGPLGRVEAPRAVVTRQMTSERFGAGLDPCAALTATVHLPPEATREILVLLGAAPSRETANQLLCSYGEPDKAWQRLSETREFWQRTVGAVQIETPCPEIDVMVNGWLPYQNLSCRMWGRSSYYQGGGALGFRDQLQDSAALLPYDPDIMRRQLLLHAAHQYEQGDVMHWWHPPASRGLRTRFSDDLLWLPYLSATYVESTGELQLWDHPVRFVRGPELEDGQCERLHDLEGEAAPDTLYEHCCLAIDRSLKVGRHGLPLIGSGDWNDGMNCVGHLGRGESVWLGFFLYDVLGKMLPVCQERQDSQRRAQYEMARVNLKEALNTSGWDGAWYRRAYLDDGTPLGSRENQECRIDAIAQAWAEISGAGTKEHVSQALQAADAQLVDVEAGIIRLLTPPLDRIAPHPGYIRGYLPGIRENGGQYTHGVLWLIMALARHGDSTRATQLLSMISPITHTRTPEQVEIYRTEPYAIAADVYGAPPHVGRGGWTWYTGSAGWYSRVVIETIFGLRTVAGKQFVLQPHISAAWPQCSITYRLPDGITTYRFSFEGRRSGDPAGLSVTVDGQSAPVSGGTARIPIVTDRQEHGVHVRH